MLSISRLDLNFIFSFWLPCAPGLSDDAVLSLSLASPGEARKYTTATVGAVHPVVRRKWSWREGSVTAEEAAAEEQERSKYPTQEALIAALYKQV